MLLLVITKPITNLLDSGIVQEYESLPKSIPVKNHLIAQWVKDETGKLICRWIKE